MDELQHKLYAITQMVNIVKKATFDSTGLILIERTKNKKNVRQTRSEN